MKRTFNYVCLNADCESTEYKARVFINKGSRITKFAKVDNFPIERDEDDKSPEPCPCCGENLKHQGYLGMQIFSGISLMDLGQKQAMMLKRSSEHAKKGEQRDRKDSMNKAAGF